MKQAILILSLQVTFVCAICQSNASVIVSLKDTNISCLKNNFTITYNITNKGQFKIRIPSELVVLRDQAADLAYEIEKYNASTNKYINYNYIVEDIAYREIKLIYLYSQKGVTKNMNLPCVFYETGKFRLRLKFFL